MHEHDRPRPGARKDPVDDRRNTGPPVVLSVDRPQNHQHPVIAQERQRCGVPQAVRRAEHPRERRAIGASTRCLLDDLRLLLGRGQASKGRMALRVVADREPVVEDS